MYNYLREYLMMHPESICNNINWENKIIMHTYDPIKKGHLVLKYGT